MSNDKHEVVNLTAQLIKINSENPINDESEVVTFLTNKLDQWDISYMLHDVQKGRQNIIATLQGKRERPPLIYIAHMDTVPAGEGWTKKPFEPVIEEGKLFGRGACDMKGGLAAALHALKRVKELAVEPPGDLIVIATVDEEGPGMMGAAKLIEDGYIPQDSLVIAPEPSNLEIVRVHKGVIWYELIAYGKMSHGGNADRGIDANHALAEAIVELKSVVHAIPFEHDIVGKAMVSIGKISGGEKTNVVPAYARAEVDLRIIPPFTVDDANKMIAKAVNRAIARVPGSRIEVNNLGLQRGPVETPIESSVVQSLIKTHREVKGSDPGITGFTAYTDAGLISLQMKHKNSVVYGPGSLQQAHSIDEWIDIEQLTLCADIFTKLALNRPA